MKNILPGILAILMLLTVSSCTHKEKFLYSSIVPAARGYVTVKKDRNNNFEVKVNLSDLAEAERLQPPRKMYIVWMLTNQGTTVNLGQINSTTHFLSNKLHSSFETVSTYMPISMFITAENNMAVQYPVGQVVLTTDRFMN
jgi:hypothetical protein